MSACGKEKVYSCRMAETTTITLQNAELFKQNALRWANHFPVVCLLDSNNYPHKKYKSKEWVLAVDTIDEINCINHCFSELENFRKKTDTDIFGFLTYDLKNEIEKSLILAYRV